MSDRLLELESNAEEYEKIVGPMTYQEVRTVLGMMVEALDLVANSGKFQCFDDTAWDKVNNALDAGKSAQ